MHTDTSSRRVWVRLLFMALYGVVFHLASMVLLLLALVQLGADIALRRPLEQLQTVGKHLGQYLRDIVEFECYQTDRLPYPLHGFDWKGAQRPAGAPSEHAA